MRIILPGLRREGGMALPGPLLDPPLPPLAPKVEVIELPLVPYLSTLAALEK